MQIKFISKIIEDIEELISVDYKFKKIDSEYTLSFSKSKLQNYFERNNYKFIVHDSFFNGCSYIEITLNYSNDSRKIRYTDINDLKYNPNPQITPTFSPTIKKNTDSPYEDTPENREIVLNIVNGLYNDVEDNITDEIKGTKKLIYFTVFGEGYTKLTEKLLESIHSYNTQKDFDVLFICHRDVENVIKGFPIINNFNAFYMNVPRPLDGVEASINKTLIFDWANINEYNKVLFLDSDILCRGNVETVFNKIVESNKLYTVYNEDVPITAHNSYTHGLTPITEEQLVLLTENNQRPFNCGQFGFINSIKMKEHFNNWRWLLANWMGEYFFEQCAGVQYFARNLLTINNLQDEFKIIIIPNNRDLFKLHNDSTIFIHFAGACLNACRKIEYIENYKSAYL